MKSQIIALREKGLYFWSKCGKIRTRKTPNMDTFHSLYRYYASNKSWESFSQGKKAGGIRSKLETRDHINVLELTAAKFGIITLTKMFPTVKVVHLQIDNVDILKFFRI